MSIWTRKRNALTFLFYAGVIALTIIMGLLFGIVASAIIILVFSSTFAGYLAERYTASFGAATFAKATCMVLFFVGITILFVAVGWWGLAGIGGYWLLLTLSRGFWGRRPAI